jgi:hypothetical protein
MTVPMMAQADATLYGSFRISVADRDGEDLDVRDQSSRIGIKANIDLGMDGVTGVAHGEWGVNTADGAGFSGRLAYAGVKGDFGQVLVGQQWTQYYLDVVGVTDVTNRNGGPTQDLFRQQNLISYISPNMNGLKFSGQYQADGDGVDDNSLAPTNTDTDKLYLTLSYEMNGFKGALANIDDGTTADADRTAYALSYSANGLTVAYMEEDRDSADDNSEYGVSYKMNNTTFVLLAQDDGSATDEMTYVAEVSQQMGKGRVWLTVTEADAVDSDEIAVGVRMDF